MGFVGRYDYYKELHMTLMMTWNYKVLKLKASTNNLAVTVFWNFVETTELWGLPSRVRGDRGGENIEVAVLMIMLRGAGRASFMWGS
jgi:hypothetical protein